MRSDESGESGRDVSFDEGILYIKYILCFISFLYIPYFFYSPEGAGVMNLVNQEETSLLTKQCSLLINHQSNEA